MFEEASLLATEDPNLDQLFDVLDKLPEVDLHEFLQGALWTKRILKIQAALSGVAMPKLTYAAADSFLISQAERAKPEQSLNDFIAKDMENLRVSEPELWEGLREITKYRPVTRSFNEGALTTYRSLQRMEEGQALASSLHI